MPIRPANSVTVLQRRLSLAEGGDVEPIEILSIHDELARLERKWVAQIAEGSDRRKSTDVDKLDLWYKRLRLLIDRSLRSDTDEATKQLLRTAACAIDDRPAIRFTSEGGKNGSDPDGPDPIVSGSN